VRLFGIALCSIAALSIVPVGYAQKPAPAVTNVLFQCDCDTELASRYATEVRDLLAKSPRYAEAQLTDKGPDGNPTFNWVIYVSSGPVDDSGPLSNLLVLSVVFTWQNDFRANYALVCGGPKISTCAVNTLASLDKTIHAKSD